MKNFYDSIILILLLIFGSMALHSQCSTTGPRNGNAFSSNAIIGTVAWANPPDAITCNLVPTVATVLPIPTGDTVTTNYLYARNFGFSIPASAMICGIEVKYIRKMQGDIDSATFVTDHAVHLMSSGGISGPNHASSIPWTNGYTNITYGSSTDNWGGSYTPANINISNFGVAISADFSETMGQSLHTASIDHVTIEVFYMLPLPVEIINFHCIDNNNREVEIYWQTVSETNNNNFTLERSADGFTWTAIEEITGAGNSNATIDYSVVDYQPMNGINYYRIKQTDFNGEYHYSEITSIQMEPTPELNMNYQPMLLSIQFFCNTLENINVSIYDFTGKGVKNKILEKAIASSTLDVADLASGIYIVVASSAGQTVVKKLNIY